MGPVLRVGRQHNPRECEITPHAALDLNVRVQVPQKESEAQGSFLHQNPSKGDGGASRCLFKLRNGRSSVRGLETFDLPSLRSSFGIRLCREKQCSFNGLSR